MHNRFKTPAIYNLLLRLKIEFPNQTELIDSYFPAFAPLDLSAKNHIRTQETFLQELNLITKETVYVVWNIDSIINSINSNPYPPEMVPIKTLLELPNIQKANWEPILTTIKNNRNKPFPHKTDYIIITELPNFPGFSIIDGNYRFGEALLNGQTEIKAYIINPLAAPTFLQPDSQKFVTTFYSMLQKLTN